MPKWISARCNSRRAIPHSPRSPLAFGGRFFSHCRETGAAYCSAEESAPTHPCRNEACLATEDYEDGRLWCQLTAPARRNGIEIARCAVDDDGVPCVCEGGAMQKEPAGESELTAAYTALKLPIMLGSLPLTMLAFLLPLYAKQLGASALGIGGLFAVAQVMMVLCRPVIGWGVDRFGRRGFCLAGLACSAGAMGVFALASNLTLLYLAQLLNGVATACTWTAVYTITSELVPSANQGEALGRVDEYAHRGALYGMGLAFVLLSWCVLD